MTNFSLHPSTEFNPRSFEAIIESAARQLVGTEHRYGSSYIRTPLMYPSGSTVIVKVELGVDRFFVSDAGLGFQEAEMMGGSLIYSRFANKVAENASVGFDNHAFFIVEVRESQLAGAVATIANCSQEAVNLTAYKIADRAHSERSDELYDRLISIFDASFIERNATVVGSSTTPYEVDVIVRDPTRKSTTVFEAVTNHKNSVASTTMKFMDISRLETPPTRVSVVRKKENFGSFLGILSQTSSIIEQSSPDEIIRRLAA